MRRLLPIFWLLAPGPWPLAAATQYMLLGYGQSLSLGNWGCGAISTSQPYSNKMLNSGATAFVSLVESGACVGGTAWSSSATYQVDALVTSGGNWYSAIAQNTNQAPPNAAYWQAVTTQESPLASAVNNVTLLDGAHAFTASANNYGVSGVPISSLQKGQSPYTALINGVTAAHSLAVAAGNTLVVLGALFTEGESDFAAVSTTYYTDCQTLQSNLQTDIQAITGQSQGVPFFFSQLSSNESDPVTGNLYVCPDGTTACIDDPTGAASPLPTIAQWRLQRDYPTKFYLTGPKYQYLYGDQGFHLSGPAYNQLGATAARVLKCLYVDGSSTCNAGVYPTRILISGKVITVTAATPVGLGLAIDTTTVPNPYFNGAYDTSDGTNSGTPGGLGFQFFQTGGNAVSISGVSVSGQTITITLSAIPTGTNQRLAYGFEGTRYAITPTAGCSADATTCNGTATVVPSRGTVHGNVRTVTDYTSLRGDGIQHWMVHFNEPIAQAPGPALRSGGFCSGCQF